MKYISYLRLSKKLDNQTQYGIQSQRGAISRYLLGKEHTIVGEYIEYETGGAKRKCPELNKALKQCKSDGAILITWKIDRLGRNLNQITTILDSDVPFVAAATPDLDKFGLQILGCVAEKELSDISHRIKAALLVAKSNGVKLGADKARAKQMAMKSAETRRNDADKFALEIFNHISKIQKHSSKTYNNSQLADALNRRRVLTRRGKMWYSHQIARVVHRAKAIQTERG